MTRKRKDTTATDSHTQPSHHLMMKSRDDKSKASRVGALWTNAAGGLSLKLNRGVVLSWRDTADCWLTVWPNDGDQRDEQVPF